MIRPVEEIQVHLCREAVDFRKQMRGLSVLVEEELALDVFDYIERFHNPRRARKAEQRKKEEVDLTQLSVKTG